MWRPVIWGLALQFIFGLLILRTGPGKKFFEVVGDQINTFLDYSDAGAAFVFGDDFKTHFFAFKVSTNHFNKFKKKQILKLLNVLK